MPVLLLGMLWSAAYLSTPHSQLARTLIWLEADVEDHKRFPARIVENAPPPFLFERGQPIEGLGRGVGGGAAGAEGADGTGSLEAFLEGTDTTAFLAIQDDAIVYEEYFDGYREDSIQTSFSMAKSFLSTLVGIAIDEGAIGSVDDPVTEYVPELAKRDPRFASITIRNLLTMSSGIAYEEAGLPWSDDATTYYAPDLRAVALSARIERGPAEEFHYNNFHPLLLGLILERATGTCVSCYLEDRIWKPLGMEAPGSWSLDSEDSGFEKLESGINARARDYARFGRLFLKEGDWNGRRIVSADWVTEATADDTSSDPADFYQYMWWVQPQSGRRDHFFARGNFGQYIYVVPDKDLILVRLGTGAGEQDWPSVLRDIAATVPSPRP
ncbi:serine hydrolase [Naasia sp. SYSU D00057]|uniref:serine hydrolase domain-containing protein n=1 Tax=Naasia sp. SYSU D00057 TaxID=2817380 RepID=UPI001B302983|nr:serine hydrolase [Naasia sp. SYSU D00057]